MRRVHAYCLFLIVLWALLGACSPTQPDSRKNPESDRGFFYKVSANYVVKDTQEKMDFDFVVACGARVEHWRHTSSTTLTLWYPNFIAKATNDGAAIGIRVPVMCERYAWGLNIDTGEPDPKFASNPPDDFIPSTIWYPDVNFLGFGIGYESEEAYQSKFSKLSFEGARLSKSNREEWLAWRENSTANYNQVGGVPGPWGHDLYFADREVREWVRTLNRGNDIAASRCGSVVSLPMSERLERNIWSRSPENENRFWAAQADLPEINFFAYLIEREPYGGTRYADHYGITEELGVRKNSRDIREVGSFRWEEGGRIVHWNGQGNFYHDVYPVSFKTMPQGSSVDGEQNRNTVRIVLDDDWKGFSFCGDHDLTLQQIEDYASGNSDTLTVRHSPSPANDWDEASITDVYVNDEFLLSHESRYEAFNQSQFIFDREGRHLICCKHR